MISYALYIKENPDKIGTYQDFIAEQQEVQQKAAQQSEVSVIQEYTKPIEENENIYIIGVGENDYEKLEIPKSDVEKLEDGGIQAKIYADKEYTVRTGNNSYKTNGEGVQELLGKGKAVEQTAKNTADAAAATANTAVNTIDGAASAAPPAKIATTAVKVVYKLVETVNSAQQSANQGQGLKI